MTRRSGSRLRRHFAICRSCFRLPRAMCARGIGRGVGQVEVFEGVGVAECGCDRESEEVTDASDVSAGGVDSWRMRSSRRARGFSRAATQGKSRLKTSCDTTRPRRPALSTSMRSQLPAEPYRGPVHRPALLRSGRHRSHQPQGAGQHDPPLHHLAEQAHRRYSLAHRRHAGPTSPETRRRQRR